MGTRCGNVDPSAVTFIGEKEQMSYAEVNNMLNKQSGVFGVSGVSSDMRDIDKAYEEGNPRAILARDMYCLRIKKFVGEYAAEMGGVDLIVFTGGARNPQGGLRRPRIYGRALRPEDQRRSSRRKQDHLRSGFKGQGGRRSDQRGAGHRHRHLRNRQ